MTHTRAVDARFPLAKQVRPLYLGPSGHHIEVTHVHTAQSDMYRYSRKVLHEYEVSRSFFRADDRGHELLGVEMSYVGEYLR